MKYFKYVALLVVGVIIGGALISPVFAATTTSDLTKILNAITGAKKEILSAINSLNNNNSKNEWTYVMGPDTGNQMSKLLDAIKNGADVKVVGLYSLGNDTVQWHAPYSMVCGNLDTPDNSGFTCTSALYPDNSSGISVIRVRYKYGDNQSDCWIGRTIPGSTSNNTFFRGLDTVKKEACDPQNAKWYIKK